MKAGRTRVLVNALLLQSHLGGIGHYCYQLLKALLDRHPDWEFTLLVPEKAAANFSGLGDRLVVRSIPLRGTLARQLYLQLVLPLWARGYSLLHSVGNIGVVLAPIPQVITLHDTYEKVSPERFHWAKRFLMGRLIALSGRRAARIIAVSGNTRKDVEKYYPRLRGKVSVVYSGNRFPVAAEAGFRDRRDFVFVGTLEPGKNLRRILEAFAAVRNADGHRLIVVGAMGWRQSHIPSLLDSLGIRDRVELRGYVPDEELKAIYGRSLALIQASAYEGFGFPIIEAMACGCPVIAARNSGMIEAGGDAALFFETDDVRALADRMETLCADPGAGREAVAKGLAHAGRFSWEKTAGETSAIYGLALGGAAGPAVPPPEERAR